jgi:hypothetical protein
MLLSESEAFWLAILNDDLASCGAFRERTRGPLRLAPEQPLLDGKLAARGKDAQGGSRNASSNQDPIEAESDPATQSQGGGEFVYDQIQEHATRFGIARRAECKAGAIAAIGEPPPDTVWAMLNGQLVSKEELEEVRREIPNRIAEARQRLSVENGSTARLDSFEIGLHAHLSLVACGYAVSTPGSLYGFADSGQPRVTTQIVPRDRGLYLSLMKLLSSSIPLPAVERLAMAAAGFRGDEAMRAWVPSLSSLNKPIGKFIPHTLKATFQEFRSSNESSEGWQLGERLNQLRRKASDCCDGADAAQGNIQRIYEADIDLEESTPERGGFLDVERDSTAGESPAKESAWADAVHKNDDDDEDDGKYEDLSALSGNVRQSPSSFADSLLQQWLAIWERADQRTSIPKDPYEEEIRDYAADGHDEMLGEFLAEVEDVTTRCRKFGLVGVVEMIRAAVDAVPQINPIRARMFADASVAYGQLSKGFSRAYELISDAMKVAYGELRLRDLKWDQHGLPAPALSGWAGQKGNIREAIKVAIEQLNNGLKPYIVLTQLAPAVQSLLGELAARHLTTTTGVSAKGLLEALREKNRRTNDEDLKVAVRIADALNTLRNRVVHEPDHSWDRDHAAFFLNGISILLRSV